MKYRVRKRLNYQGTPFYKAEITGWWTPFWFCIGYQDKSDDAWRICKDHSLGRYNKNYRDPEGLYATSVITVICLIVFCLPIILGVRHV